MDEATSPAFNVASLRITPQILALIAGIDAFRDAWRAIDWIAPERRSALCRAATIESIGASTRIEGARLSDRAVGKLLANLPAASLATRDEQEVAGYAQVLDTILQAHDAIALTENHILQLHRDLLAHSTRDERHRGAYKTLPNHIEAVDAAGRSSGVVFATATPFVTPGRMAELVGWFRAVEAERSLHPLLLIAIFIMVFLAIHPFQDGNGRLSRLLTTLLLLLRAGYAHLPYGSLESVIEQQKEEYYLALRRTQGTIRTAEPDWNPWVEFFLGALHEQKQRLERTMECQRILELAREHGRAAGHGTALRGGASSGNPSARS
nr:Fic family protein [Geminicoccus harenae]